MIRSASFLSRLQSGGTLLADGAAGTQLQSMGLPTGVAPEVWVLEQPDRIRALHREYLQAGAGVILTCSFGGNLFRLSGHGLGDQVIEVNRRAAEIAREVAGDQAWVGGDMGPTGQLLEPLGKLTPKDVSDAFAEQANGLSQGGVDFLLIETMSDLGEAEAAIAGVRRVTDLPVVCTFSFDSHGRTMMGLKPETVAQRIGPLVEAVGANCGKEPSETVGIMQAMSQAVPGTILWAKPNAGLPRMVDESMVYDASPETMGQLAQTLSAVGVQVIGGCCGTTPAHVSAMAAALERPTVKTRNLRSAVASG